MGEVFVKRDGKPVSPILANENEASVWLLRHQPMSTDWALKHEGYSIAIIEPWDASKAKELRGQALGLISDHGHSPRIKDAGEREMTMDNCGACALAGHGESTESGPLMPNYAGWARVYVQAGRAIPRRYRRAFDAERHQTDNLLYAEGLARDIVTFGLRLVGE